MSSDPQRPTGRVTLSIRFDEHIYQALVEYKRVNRQSNTAAVMTLLEQALRGANYLPPPAGQNGIGGNGSV